MDKTEWLPIVAKLSASYPGQELRPETAVEWWEELKGFPAGEVWLAIRRCRRERDWMPNGVAVILDAIDANYRERADERRQSEIAKRARPGPSGVPMPDETRQALEILEARLRGELDGPIARRMIEELADQLEVRVAARPETAGDATRTCPECSTSPAEGWCLVPEETGMAYQPCPMCRPGRYEAWRAGRTTAKADKEGYPVKPGLR